MPINVGPAEIANQLDALRSNPIRERILWVAMGEAVPASKVSDRIPVMEEGQRVRFGWRRLKQYFDEACNNVNPSYWKQRGHFKGKEISNLDGVRLQDHRVPQRNYAQKDVHQPDAWYGGIHWCGIFATWVWKTAGVDVKWMWPGPSRVKARQQGTPQVGDILVMSGKLVHHCVLLNKVGWQTVNGNSEFQSVLIKPTNPANISYYYSVDDLK
jgi:hypothetical protein